MVDAENLGGVEAENLILDFRRQLRVTKLVHEVVGDLEPAQPFDLTLRAAVPDRVSSPENVVGAGDLDHLPKHVHAEPRSGSRQNPERAAQLEVDVLDFWVALEDAQDVGDPGDL